MSPVISEISWPCIAGIAIILFDRVRHSSGVAQRESRGNGCVERFIRTLKEQLLWLTRFATVDELDVALRDFAQRYNNHWILGRLGYKTPAQHRRSFLVEGGVIYANTCVNNGILYSDSNAQLFRLVLRRFRRALQRRSQ